MTEIDFGCIIHASQQGAHMFKVQIDMAEFGEQALWQDVEGIEFKTYEQARAHITWMKGEYGDTIEYRIV